MTSIAIAAIAGFVGFCLGCCLTDNLGRFFAYREGFKNGQRGGPENVYEGADL